MTFSETVHISLIPTLTDVILVNRASVDFRVEGTMLAVQRLANFTRQKNTPTPRILR